MRCVVTEEETFWEQRPDDREEWWRRRGWRGARPAGLREGLIQGGAMDVTSSRDAMGAPVPWAHSSPRVNASWGSGELVSVVASFLDVPSLGRAVCVSRLFRSSLCGD